MQIVIRLAQMLLWGIAVIALTFLMINIHEIGHTVAARLGGDSTASYHLYQTYRSGELDCIGCNVYDPSKLSFWGKFWNAAGGVLATQAVAILALGAIRYRVTRRTVGRLLKVFVVICVIGDALYQTVQALLAPIATQSGLTNVDFADALYLLHVRFGYSVIALKGSLTALTLLYVTVMLWLTLYLTPSSRAAGRERS
ncbi:MAG: hypothetical protein ACREOA_02935 [Candidatus Dormibacteria bacterium]